MSSVVIGITVFPFAFSVADIAIRHSKKRCLIFMFFFYNLLNRYYNSKVYFIYEQRYYNYWNNNVPRNKKTQ